MDADKNEFAGALPMIDLDTLLRSLTLSVVTLSVVTLGAPSAWALDLSIRDKASGEPVERVVVSIPSADALASTDQPAAMTQQDRTFMPHLLVVPEGSAVDFPNLDNTQHHVYSFSPTKTFNIELYADRPEAPITFDKPGVVELGCNIHDQMRGFIYVTGSAQTVTTGAAGIARITPPGDEAFDIRIWHERLTDNSQPQTFRIDANAASPTVISLELTPPPSDSNPFADLQRRFDAL